MALQLTELEEKLSQPGGFALQQHMLAGLAATASRLRQQVAASVPRAEFELYQKTIDAVQAAIEVLQSWPVRADNTVQDSLSLLRLPAGSQQNRDPSTADVSVSPGRLYTNPSPNPTRNFS